MTWLLEPPFHSSIPQNLNIRHNFPRFQCSCLPPPEPESIALSLDGPKERRKIVRLAWEKLVRWSRSLCSKAKTDVLERTNKIVVLGGGSFGTAMAAHVATRKSQLEVNMLVRDPQVCLSINEKHHN